VLCEPCSIAWQSYQQPFVGVPPSGPNPAAAAVLGLIPGVGAMYNGQFFKGLIHVVIFAVLVSLAGNVNGIFGIFIAAWVLYQSFEAYHTAQALRAGAPLPDPLGLNDVGNWLNLGARPAPGQPGVGPAVPPAGTPPDGTPPASAAVPPPPDQAGWQTPYQGSSYPGSSYPGSSYPGSPYSGPNPYAPPPGFPPPPPPPPPQHWRKEPVGAVILIGLGLLFLLGKLDFFSYRFFDFTWPLMLIGLGVWLIVRRVNNLNGGPK
jgi:TM2 domain-containing membrane protein YozV